MNDNLDPCRGERITELEQANDDLRSYAWTVCHELQEPLRNITSIIGKLQSDWTTGHDVGMIRAITGIGEAIRSTLNTISAKSTDSYEDLSSDLKSTEQLLGNLEQLWRDRINPAILQTISKVKCESEREYTKIVKMFEIAKAGFSSTRGRVDLQTIIEDVKINLGSLLEESGVRLEYPDSLPVVSGDSVLVHQVFQNLISNAIKYNDRAEKTVRITSELADESGWWKISVQDNGIGIREKDRSKVFEIFTQLHSPNKFERGVGLGLTIVKKSIESHGGRIDFRSVPGEGTTFFFTLPAFQETLDASAGAASHSDR